jgi:hypothetical protein
MRLAGQSCGPAIRSEKPSCYGRSISNKGTSKMPLIDVHHAVQAAVQYVNRFPGLLPTGDVRLEEVVLDEQTGDWLVTLSFIDNPVLGTRTFKIFRIDGASSNVRAMLMRNPLEPARSSP